MYRMPLELKIEIKQFSVKIGMEIKEQLYVSRETYSSANERNSPKWLWACTRFCEVYNLFDYIYLHLKLPIL